MKEIVKNIIALSISGALSASFMASVNAATYQIVDTGEPSELKHTYSQKQNLNGDIAITGTDLYNFPVQFDYFSENDFLTIELYSFNRFRNIDGLDFIEDSEALRAGTPTANDLAWVMHWLRDTTSAGQAFNIKHQKIGDTSAITYIGGVKQTLNLWDKEFTGSQSLTRSTVDVVNGITNNGIIYGTATAPYLPSDTFTDELGEEHTFWLREHGSRGFYVLPQSTQIQPLVPLETQYGGGTSAIMDVNEAGTAVGFSSYKLAQSFIESVEGRSNEEKTDEENKENTCADATIVPAQMTLDACIASLLLSTSANPYHNIAIKTVLDSTNSPVIEPLGLLVTPHPDDQRSYSSYALAINNNGVAVGYADGFNDENVTEPTVDQQRNFQYAVAYKNGEVIDLTDERINTTNSRAYDINDAGIAVGHITKGVNGKGVDKFFYVDTSVPKEEIAMVIPKGYFSSSSSTVRAINNQGLMVGEGEIETHDASSVNPRRTAAFVYNMHDDTLTNLNDVIPCDLRLTYNILEARDINDNGVILATAVIKTNRKDAKGEVILGDDGAPLTEDVLRTISLEPMADNNEVCSAAQENKVVRQGASTSLTGVLSIMALLGLRRKFFS